jgi:protein-S-isoprenylcysteine O-methyltransferase Ste14
LIFHGGFMSQKSPESVILDYETQEPISPPMLWLIHIATILENYILPVFYLWLAWNILAGPNDLDAFNTTGFWSQPWAGISTPDWLLVAQSALLFIVQLSIGVTLIINRRPAARYRTAREIFVPLLAAFYFVTYDYVDVLPFKWTQSLILDDDPRRSTIAMIGLIVGVVGTGISVWGVLSLGRSFGILVAVRKVVVRGPYRFVRHPIYFGYILSFIGILLVNPAPIYFVLVPVNYAIMAWRSKLEESKLARFSPEYSEHMKHTGFIFPRMPWEWIG